MFQLAYLHRLNERIDAAVDELYALRATHGVPIGWVVGPASRPLDLGRQLEARGLEHLVTLTPMTMSLDGVPLPAPVTGLTIGRVRTPADYEAWVVTEHQGFEEEGDADEDEQPSPPPAANGPKPPRPPPPKGPPPVRNEVADMIASLTNPEPPANDVDIDVDVD